MAGSTISTNPGSNASSTSAIAQSGTTALGNLNNNFSTFLTLLLTQMKNQDPSSPMDSNQFTTELVQFSSVEQQINTNSSLTQLIQLTQASQLEQSSSMIGKTVSVNSSQISLQGGSAGISFAPATAAPVDISVFNSAGAVVHSETVASGQTSWKWNGKDASGTLLPDGAYKISATTAGQGGTSNSVPYTVTGKTTSIESKNGAVQLNIGGLTVPFSAVTSVR